MNKLYLIITLLFLGILNSNLLFAQENVEIGVNKNIELLFAMQIQSNMDSVIVSKGYNGFPLTTQFDSQMKENYKNALKKYDSCSQIEFSNKFITNNYIFFTTLYAVIMADSLLNISNPCWPAMLPIPKVMKDSAILLIEKLNEFKNLSSFDKIYQDNEPVYNLITERQENRISAKEMVNSIEVFFGWELPGYHVVLAPMMWPGGISIEYKENCDDSIGHTFILIGPKRVTNGTPDFGTVDEYTSVVIHEFIHPFIMQYCVRNQELIEQYSYLYENNKIVYQNNGVPSWFNAVNEILTRTVEIILQAGDDKEKSKKLVEFQSTELGFKYIPVLYEAFEKYFSIDKRDKAFTDTDFRNIISYLKKIKK